MSTHTDGAPPSVAPEPNSGSGSAETAQSGAELDTESGVTWLQAEMQRRMAAARNGSGGRHARHGGPDPTPAQAEYQARHASDRAGAAGRRAAGLPSPVQPTRGDDGAEVPTAWTSPPDPAPPRPRSGAEGEAQPPLAELRPRADPAPRPDGDGAPAPETPFPGSAGDGPANPPIRHRARLPLRQPRADPEGSAAAPPTQPPGPSGAPRVSGQGAPGSGGRPWPRPVRRARPATVRQRRAHP